MNYKLIKYISILLILAGFSAQVYAEGVNKGKKTSLNKVAGSPSATKFNINQISTWFMNDGSSDLDNLGNSGFVYPKGYGKTAFYQSGFVWGGKVGDNVRVGGSTYGSGLVPGAVKNGAPEDEQAPNVHIYRVRKDYKTGSMSAEVRDGEGTDAEVRAQYENDWMTWPADEGAPFEDVDGNGQYDPNVDIPGVPGADQTIWFVNNDFNRTKVKNLYGSEPIGLECQTTIWGYGIAGPLGNMLFRKYKLINKGQNNVTDMYVSMWSDPDLGDATDDLAGCDTTLSLAFVYNGDNSDGVYQSNPPACGFDFFQGPVVAGNPTDSAVFNGKRVYGKKNLPMTAFYYFINGNAVYADPNLADDYQGGTLAFYRLLQGKQSTIDAYFPVPDNLGGGVTKFPLSGDPVAGTGYLDGKLFPPDDRRMGMASGPFTMAIGDTQEIVVAQMVAGGPGSGLNNIQAVKLLKTYDEKAQEAYDNFFVLPSAPRAPMVNVTELNKEVVLDWGSDAKQVAETEGHDVQGYKFQGYNIYQLPQANSTPNQAIRIATYDLVDGVKFIMGDVVDPASGVTVKAAQQFGSDSGIKHSIDITKDYVTNLPLVNGKKYYYAVTAYAYTDDPVAVPNNLENPLAVMTVTPHTPDPGVRYNSAYGDSIVVTRTGGKSDGSVVVTVIDPKVVTGHQYSVTFDTLTVYDADLEANVLKYVWSVNDVTANQVKISKQFNQSGDDAYLTVDGLLIKVLGPPNGVKDWDIPAGARQFTWAGATGLGLEGFNGTIGAGATWLGSSVGYDKMKNVILKLAAVDTNGNAAQGDPNVSFAYRYLRGSAAAPKKPEFADFIINKGPGVYQYQDFKNNFPFAAYDVEDPANPRRLAVGYLENNSTGGTLDGKYWPPIAYDDNVGVNSPREWFFIFDTDYSTTPDPALQTDVLSGEMPVLYQASVNRRTDSWPGGDEFEILANHINLPADSWTFTSKTVSESSELAKQDVEKINVFPNPYYAVNSQELNKYQRFVTFSHLPQTATIRIFNLAGQLVKTIQKDSPDQFQRWDLATDSGLPVASGLYIVYVDMPQLGKTKILKVAVIQEQQILDRF
ncbi:MAG TPA: T9SS type A sorting domain-containing protein [Ignavibacteriales bacterium]|nr:T9SS type A sorting domain-containing protein [Ignavibacteriales bacterium]